MMWRRYPEQSECVMQFETNNGIWIGLGSNLGDPRHNLNDAVEQLRAMFGTPGTVSGIYRSEPVELRDQPWFYNQVIGFPANPVQSPFGLMRELQDLEKKMGRVSGIRYGPRVIDLDILFYRNWIVESAVLTIPHPKAERRSFVLQPLAETAPELVHPLLGVTVGELWQQRHTELDFCEKIIEL